ncbi:MAG: Asp23/Gls24 family envelope stress response protein [Bacilli bacterium]
MYSYFYVGNSQSGKLAISSFAFSQIAESTLDSLVTNGDLKDAIALKDGKKKCKVTTDIDKNKKVTVTVQVIGIRGADIDSAVTRIQKEVFTNIYDVTEISALKVNVSVLAVVDKTNEK